MEDDEPLELFTYRMALADHYPVLIGYPIFDEVDFKDLKVGDKITHVGYGGGIKGSGKITSSANLDQYKEPVVYAGRIKVQHHLRNDEAEFIGFRLYYGGIVQKHKRNVDGVPIEDPVYILYEIGYQEEELYLVWLSGGGPSIRIFRAKFKKA